MILPTVELWANYNVPGRGMVSKKVVMVDGSTKALLVLHLNKLVPAHSVESFFSITEAPLATP